MKKSSLKISNGEMTEKSLLSLILALFLILGMGYAIITPVFEASDELWHYPMIQHLAKGNPLPVQVFDPEQAGPWKQEASQPPLYYYLGAALTFWIDTSDIAAVRWLNPHVDNGVITKDGNINLVLHDPEANQWTGTALAVRIVRFLSVLLGALTVYLTFRIGKEVAPEQAEIALGAAAVNAFTPMFLFISGAVNNDNLVIPLASFALLLMIQIAKGGDYRPQNDFLRLITLGAIIGLGALTKITALGLLPLAAGALFINSWRAFGRKTNLGGIARVLWQSAISFLVVLLPVLLIAGWWYYRNIWLYGDWSGWNAFIAVLGQRAHPASLAQLWDERWGFMLSYWGLFGGLNVPMWEGIYHILNGVLIASVIGFVVYLGKLVRIWTLRMMEPITNLQTFLYNVLAFIEHHIALVLCLSWGTAVVVGLIRWATTTWSSQGRLVFSSISALSILMVIGLAGWMPQKLARITTSGLASFMFLVSAMAPLVWIKPAYEPPKPADKGDLRVVNVDFDNYLRLIGYDLETEETLPGQDVEVILQWEVLQEMEEDWSVFVHLNDPVLDAPVAQRDMFLGQGLVATSLLKPGDSFTERYNLALPATVVTPAELSLVAGLYDYATGDRLKTDEGFDSVTLDSVSLKAAAGNMPNPIQINFENELQLVGFEIEPRRLTAGNMVGLRLYWRPLKDLDRDYTFFAQVIDEDTTRWASHDLAQPTSTWTSNEVTDIDLSLELDAGTPAGVYPVIVGVYIRPAGGGFDRLQMVTTEGRLTDDFLPLAKVRVDESE